MSLAAGFLGGAHFPLANRLLLAQREQVGRTAGALYAFDLLGSTLGSLLVGFLLIPVVGALQSLAALALINAAPSSSSRPGCGEGRPPCRRRRYSHWRHPSGSALKAVGTSLTGEDRGEGVRRFAEALAMSVLATPSPEPGRQVRSQSAAHTTRLPHGDEPEPALPLSFAHSSPRRTRPAPIPCFRWRASTRRPVQLAKERRI